MEQSPSTNSTAGLGESGGERPTVNARERWEVPVWLDRLAAWVWRLGIAIAGIYLLLRLFWILRLVTVPLLFSLVFTALLWPLRRVLTSRLRLPAAAASLVVMLLVAAALVAAGWLVSVGVNQQLSEQIVWAETRAEVEDWLVDGPLDLTEDQIERYEAEVLDATRTGAVSIGMSRARLVVELIGASLLTAVLVFFFLKDGPRMWEYLSQHIHAERREAIDRAGKAAFRALAGYARGVALTGVFDAVAVGIVLIVLGVPLALPLALLTFFAAFLPIVGATVVGALSTVVALVTVGPQAAIILAIATIVIQQVEGDVVLPLVMGSQVKLHPAVILLSLAFGGAVAGIVGAFVAVPLAAMSSAAVRAFRAANQRRSLALPTTPASDLGGDTDERLVIDGTSG